MLDIPNKLYVFEYNIIHYVLYILYNKNILKIITKIFGSNK
jgi:hypothetical protein